MSASEFNENVLNPLENKTIRESGQPKKSFFKSTYRPRAKSPTREMAMKLARWGVAPVRCCGIVEHPEGGFECTHDAYARKKAKQYGKADYDKCQSPGKRPYGAKWQKYLTTDLAILCDEWKGWKGESNVGFATGSLSGLVIIDIDGETGFKSLAALEAKFGKLPKTVLSITGSGGRHYIFRIPAGETIHNSASTFGAKALGVDATKIDIRGEGGQAIAPPSRHKSGNNYQFAEGCSIDDIAFVDVPELPAWAVQACKDAASDGAKNVGTKAKKESGPEGQRDNFADAGDAMPGKFTEGVEHFLSLIGDHDGGAGFEDPIYRAACSYFSRNGVDAPSEVIHKLLRDRITVAERDPNKERGGYDDDDYLSGRIEQAREFIAGAKQRDADNALETVESEIEALTLDTLPSDLDTLFAALGSLDIPIARRDGLFDKICAKIGVTKGNDKRSLKSRLTPHVKAAEAKRDTKKVSSAKEKEREERTKKGGKPVLSLDDLGFMPCVEVSFARMLEINETKARYFDMGGQKVVIRKNARGMVETIPLDRGELLSELDHICDWVEYDKEGHPTLVACHHRVADDIIYYPERALPYIERISYTPFFTSTGQLVATDGYHAESGVYCALPPELMNLSVPDEPTPEQVKEAVGLYFDDLLVDFPFNDRNGNGNASRANALALALERYVRAMIAGPVPIYIFDKPVAGTGGSLAAEAIMTAVLGKPPKGKPQKTDENELRKEFTSFLMSGAPFYYMDNVNHRIEGGVWASKITLPEWEDRILGSSRNASFLNHNSTVGTGNKVRLSAEMARRAVFIRQAVKGDPKKRSSEDFKHYPLMPWALENHAKLVKSALIIVQAWIAAGKPSPKKVPHFASFESYTHVIGGILENAGVEGFLSNMRIAKESAYEDKHVEQMLCYEWFKRSGQDIRGIGDPTSDMEYKNGKRQSVSNGPVSLITIIRDEGIGVELNWEASTKSQMNTLVNWLKIKLDEEVITIAPGLDVSLEIIPPSDRKRNPRGKGNLYRLECVGYDPQDADSLARGLWSQWAFDWKDAALQIDAAFAGSPDWSDADELANGPEAKKKVPPKHGGEPRSERR